LNDDDDKIQPCLLVRKNMLIEKNTILKVLELK